MPSEPFDRLAVKILEESLRLKKGETIAIETWNNGLPFARRVLLESKKKGALPLLILEDEEAFVEAGRTLPDENIGKMGGHEYSMLAATNAYVFIPGPPIAVYTKALTPEKKTSSTAYNVSWYDAAEKAKLRGVRMSFGYIGRDQASLYGKKPEAMVAHQIRASLIDYNQVSRMGKKAVAMLEDGFDATIVSRGQLGFQLKGEVVVEDGIVDEEDVSQGNSVAYIPPGRVRKGVEPSSLSGEAEFSTAETPWGRIQGIKLRFKGGVLQSWSCRRGKEALRRLFNVVPEDKRRVSSVEIGLNPALKYGYGQDRFVSGGITVNLPRLSCVASRATFAAKGRELVRRGRLAEA